MPLLSQPTYPLGQGVFNMILSSVYPWEYLCNNWIKFVGKHRYTQNGILHMLDRNRRIKPKPERFQNCKEHFDMIITCEERVYDQVIEGWNEI